MRMPSFWWIINRSIRAVLAELPSNLTLSMDRLRILILLLRMTMDTLGKWKNPLTKKIKQCSWFKSWAKNTHYRFQWLRFKSEPLKTLELSSSFLFLPTNSSKSVSYMTPTMFRISSHKPKTSVDLFLLMMPFCPTLHLCTFPFWIWWRRWDPYCPKDSEWRWCLILPCKKSKSS